MKISILSIVIFISSFAMGQLTPEEIRAVDSLKNIIESTENDSIKIRALNSWDDIIYISDPSLDFEINREIEAICEKKLANKNLLDANMIGYYKGRYATALNILGLIYQDQGDYQTSIEYHYKSMTIAEELSDSLALSRSYNNIGLLHSILNNYTEALYFYNKKVEIENQSGDEKSLALVLGNIGEVYFKMDSLDKAYDYYIKSLKLYEKYGSSNSLAGCYNRLAQVFQKKEQYDSIFSYYSSSLQTYQNVGYKRGISAVKTNLGKYFLNRKEYQKAKEYLSGAFQIDTVSNNFEDLLESSLGLYQLYCELGNYKAALEMYRINRSVEDSIFSNKNAKAMFQQQYRYEYDKKVATDSIQRVHEKKIMDAELLASETEIKRQEEQKYFFVGGLFIALIFAVFILNRYRITRRQKKLIERQKHKVEEQRQVLAETNDELKDKNIQITDSINYAQRIQKAVLPSKEKFSNCFTDTFIFYRPKDVVSGDFHWFTKVDDTILFAAADCTGHGVPGAFMSIVGNNLLDKIVSDHSFHRPDLILNRLNTELHDSLNKDNSEELSDGMDIAICSVNLKTKKLLFSGAHNPLYLIRNGELIEYKGDRLHLGDKENTKGKDFSLIEVEIQTGDLLYVFSDGFVDQKGGEKGKKFFYQPFKDLLVTISSEPMEKQKQILGETILAWQGEIPQFDDMLIVGVKI